MGYTLEAIIAKPSVLAQATFDFAASKVVRLTPEIAMFPVTSNFIDSFPQTFSHNAFADFFAYLSQPLAEICSSLSAFGVVAYVEADFFGGVGQQKAAVWKNQQLVLGPLEEAKAIKQALRLLGVKRDVWTDEFNVVNLGRYRENGEWLTEGE